MRKDCLLILLVAALVAVSACGVSIKETLAKTHASAEVALAAVDDYEVAQCQPEPTNLSHCLNAAIPDAVHQKLSAALVRAYQAQQRAGAALLAWKAGTPIPKDVSDLMAVALQAEQVVAPLSPDAAGIIQGLKDRIETWVAKIKSWLTAYGG